MLASKRWGKEQNKLVAAAIYVASSLRGRRSKGKGKGIRARGEGN